MTVAGVDIGASWIRIQVLDRDGIHRHNATTSLPAPGTQDWGHALVSLIATSLVSAQPDRSDLSTVAVGLTGLPGLVEQPSQLAAAISTRIGAHRVLVASDSLTTHVGALDMTAGTVIAAGTGAIALSTDHRGAWQQADGWGALLGDTGGGAWIGAQGLRAALRAHDHRQGGSSQLLDALVQQFGSLHALLQQVYGGPSAAQVLASFALKVATVAEAGDPVARDIWQQAGRQLAHTAAAAAERLPTAPVSWGGGLFDAGNLLLDPFTAELERLHPGVALWPPQHNAVEGALRMADEDRSMVSRPPYLYVHDTPDSHPIRLGKEEQA